MVNHGETKHGGPTKGTGWFIQQNPTSEQGLGANTLGVMNEPQAAAQTLVSTCPGTPRVWTRAGGKATKAQAGTGHAGVSAAATWWAEAGGGNASSASVMFHVFQRP